MNYVYAGYAVGFGGVALYALRVVLRGRALRRALGLSSASMPSSAAGLSAGAAIVTSPPNGTAAAAIVTSVAARDTAAVEVADTGAPTQGSAATPAGAVPPTDPGRDR